MKKENKRFKPTDIRELLNKQNFKCYLTGRELTPANVEAEHIIPLNKGGKHELENLCLIVDSLRDLKRHNTVEEIVALSKEIVKLHGKK